MDSSLLFVTMGMVIIDEIHFEHRPSVYDVIGGAGTYGVVGARMFLSKSPQKVGWIIDCGSDFPESVKNEIDGWNTSAVLRSTPHRLTTRGWNKYGSNEERAFKYTSPKLRIEVQDLIRNSPLALSRSFHLICSPTRCMDINTKLQEYWNSQSKKSTSLKSLALDHFIIWEPVPDECRPETWPACIKALKDVDIITPNAKEAAMFFGLPEFQDKSSIESLAEKFVDYLSKPGAALVLRCGTKGCLVRTQSSSQWYPAYHGPQFADYKVVDPTGGGNSFVGGFAAGLILGNSLEAAAICANVAASFAIEQIGMPQMTYNGGELWNGRDVNQRITEYCHRSGFEVPKLDSCRDI
jgi:sugar/nucleoside kinase (ribokinase family)